jgi:hypothetical protein
LAKALSPDDDVLGMKLAELIGTSEDMFLQLNAKQLVLYGFRDGARKAIEVLLGLVPLLRQRYLSLKSLFDQFFKGTDAIVLEIPDDDLKKKTGNRPGTARIREVSKYLRCDEIQDHNETVKELASKLEADVAKLPMESPFSDKDPSSEGPSLFCSSYEEMVRLEHILVRCDIVCRESELFMQSPAIVPTDLPTESSVDEREDETISTSIRALPPIVLLHPLAAAAALAAITKKLKDLNDGALILNGQLEIAVE